MDFGVNFFPSVGPAEKTGETYFAEALDLVGLLDELGYGHVRTVEHYFKPYGGYSPNPALFLAAAAQRSRKARLVTGAVLPIFNHPLKLAGELALLDALSGGRLDVGFARAFLPHEFLAFGRDLDESRARFTEGVEQVRRLLAEENVTSEGEFHSFRNVTSLPRPVQQPHPPIWIAAFATPESFEAAGRAGHSVMAIPLAIEKMTELMGIYREAWKTAGHPGEGRMMLSFAMYCAPTRDEARAVGAPALEGYLAALVAAASAWTEGSSSADYPGYDKMIAGLKAETFQSQYDKGIAWIGAPDEITDMIADYLRKVGRFESASLQVNFHDISGEAAAASMRLFSEQVMPKFKGATRAA
jgi:alkanesulfonate monooxygenase SsuD/methylene tetrahydromethanopterin reductase-like flavin-dependent oxidoreductase (luciferase family)